MDMRSLGVDGMRWRRVVVAVACVAVAIAVGVRIWWVNANSIVIPVERYGMDEWVELEGTYAYMVLDFSDGYSVKVESAEVMSAQEYLDRYAEGSSYEPDNPDEALVVVNLVVRNNRPSDIDEADIESVGAINMLNTIMIPHNAGGMMYTVDKFLWCEAEEAFEDNLIMWVGVMPGTEYTMHCPYILAHVVNTDPSIGADKPVSDTFDLVLGNFPVRREIEVTI